jgi:hypothetical protein
MLNIFKQQNKNLPENAATSMPVAVKRPDFRKYVDPTNEFQSKDLGRALWFVQNKVALYRVMLGALVLVIAVSWGYSLLKLGDYLIFGLSEQKKLQAEAARFIDYTPIHAHYSPQPLQIVSTRLLPGGVEKYDAIAEISNPNDRWEVEFNYWFDVNGNTTTKHTAHLMPGETRPVAVQGLQTSGGGASVMLDGLVWHRISNKTVPDPASWQAERLQFTARDFNFIPANSTATSSASSNIIRFTLINNSAYGYHAPFFYLGLMSNGVLEQLMPFYSGDMQSLATTTVDVRSFVPNLNISEIQLYPIINLYDPNVYLAPPH